MEIHGFVDASEKAYKAAVYLRKRENSEWHTGLIMAKIKVAPLKQISLSRLELCFPSYAASGLRVRSFAHVSKAYAHVNRLYGGIRIDDLKSSFTVEDVHGQSSVGDTINLSGSTMTSRRG